MNWYSEEDNLLRRYLLDDVTAEERQVIEDKLLNGDTNAEPTSQEDLDFVDRLLLAEDELIDDYSCEALTLRERELFERNFLSTPERRNQLAITKELAGVAGSTLPAETQSTENAVIPMTDETPTTLEGFSPPQQVELRKKRDTEGYSFWQKLLNSGWKLALAGLLLLGFGIGSWWLITPRADMAVALKELNRAYRTDRPLESRISGLDYAKFSSQRGNDQPGKELTITDQMARDRAERLLLDAVAEHPDSATLHALGRVYLVKREFDKAIDLFSRALQQEPNNAVFQADLGAALLEKLKIEDTSSPKRDRPELENQALDHLNRAIVLDPQLPEALFNRALLYQTLNLYQQAREAWEQYLSKDSTSPWAEEARANLEELRKKAQRSTVTPENLYSEFWEAYRRNDGEAAWRAYSNCYIRQGNFITGKLVDDFLAQAADGKKDAAKETLGALGFLGQLSERKTEDHFNAALAAAYKGADARRRTLLAQGRELRQQAYQFSNKTQYDQAAEACQAALRLFAAAGVVEEELVTDYWLAETYLRRSEHWKSLAEFERVARGWQQHNCHWWYAMTLNRLANVHGDLEEFSAAVKYALEARQIFARVEDESGVLRTLITLSSLYRDTGKYRDSIALTRQSFLLADRLAVDDTWIVTSYNVAANSFRALDLPVAALEFQIAAVRLAEKVRHPQTIARYYVQLGLLYERLRDFDAAIKHIQTGLTAGDGLQQSATNQDIRSYGLLHLGRVLRCAGHNEEALHTLDEAEAFYRGKGWEALNYLITKERFLAQIAIGNVQSAQQELNRVLHQFEINRTKILRESLRNSFFDTQQEIYDAAIKFSYVRLGHPEEAFAYAETSRSRSLLDASSTARATTDDLEGPDVILPTSVPPLSLAEIQRSLPPQTQLVQFALLEDRLLIWLITESKIVDRQVVIPALELTYRVKAYLNQLAAPRSENESELRRKATELEALLIGPIEDLLDKNCLLGVVPDKILNFLPLGALVSNRTGNYLIEDYTLVYAPSATLFIRSSENAARKAGLTRESLLSVGNPAFDRARFPDLPSLPDAANEALEIASLYPSNWVLIGKDAHKKAITSRIEEADVVHLAAHYVADDRSPLLSRLILAPLDGQTDSGGCDLAMYEVYHLPLAKARLVVLSACRTKAEEYYKGEGAIGLSRPFEAAGVPLVISSLWPVDSDYTSKLMIRLHQLRRQQGATTASALRTAQREMLQSATPRYRHPYYWAGFIVTGGHSTF
ncbi:MAG: CHAT domain-containing protein [Acidobacteria bacterium]|nr:CHAT domain-containing protein [Acidobacteriota bacterium]